MLFNVFFCCTILFSFVKCLILVFNSAYWQIFIYNFNVIKFHLFVFVFCKSLPWEIQVKIIVFHLITDVFLKFYLLNECINC